MYVLVPVAALRAGGAAAAGTRCQGRAAVLAVSAGAPMLPKKLGSLGADSYVFSLVVLSSLLAIVLVPMWLLRWRTVWRRGGSWPPRVIALAIAKAFLLPLIVGMVAGQAVVEAGRVRGVRCWPWRERC